MDSILNSNTYSCYMDLHTMLSPHTNVQSAHCTYHAVQCLCLCSIIIGKQMEHYNRAKLFPQESRFVKDFGWLGIRAESWNIFWSETEKRKILTFLVAQVSPLCTSFDCTAVSMQQRFDNLGFYTKIYKKFLLQILEAISYFFSSSLVLFASSDSWKKTCVKNLVSQPRGAKIQYCQKVKF